MMVAKEKNTSTVRVEKIAHAKVAVIFFPGNNREQETKEAADAAGMQAEIIRWNQKEKVKDFDGYIIPGGWSYEDRIRAGAISAKDPIMQEIKKEAKKGKPVLGICNGAQILIEAKMVPDIDGSSNLLEMALAPNINNFVSGFYSKWVELEMTSNKKTAFNSHFIKGEKIRMPIAHGEGRFTTKDEKIKKVVAKEDLVVFKYSKENPNASLFDAAAICNVAGNVMSIMPHPECGSFFRQDPVYNNPGACLDDMEKTTTTNKIFASMKEYILENKAKWQKN